MKLHIDKTLFENVIRATAEKFKINPVFIEKDYWITKALYHLSNSEYSENVVFKGGTSLSKAYQIIQRFSEDIDIAILHHENFTGNQVKSLIRSVEKSLATDLEEIEYNNLTSKGSRFRKSVYQYVSVDKLNKSNRLIMEINSFANPIPFEKLPIKSFVYDFLVNENRTDYIEQYMLNPIEINVLSKSQTLLEKLVSLIRFSFDEDTVRSLSSKIRHFYDIYFLLLDKDCVSFAYSAGFFEQFQMLLEHDQQTFNEPIGWDKKSLLISPLIIDFQSLWELLKEQYTNELSALAFREIPSENDVRIKFEELLTLLK